MRPLRPRPLALLLLCTVASSAALVIPVAPRVPVRALRACSLVAQADDDEDSAGVGFQPQPGGTKPPSYAAEEERGRAYLQQLKEASAERGYDYTLQGLQDRPEDKSTVPEPTAEEMEKFKSTVTLGLAGFLIVGGVLSLVVGGSLWEPSEDSTSAADESPAFGFAPKPLAEAPPPDAGQSAPSW